MKFLERRRFAPPLKKFHSSNQQLPKNDYTPLRHEAIAWVNRVGQLFYFATSELVKCRLGATSIPAIESVMLFRNKHAAHRSIDAPRKEDDAAARVRHAVSMSDIGGAYWTPKVPGTHPSDVLGPPVDTHYLSFQILGKDDMAQNLVLERDHPLVLGEGYEVLSKLLAGDAA